MGILLIVSMIPGYTLIKYGVHFGDEPYQILNTMDYYNSPLSPLTSFFCGIFGTIVDFKWIAFRYLALTLSNLAIISSGLYLYYESRKLTFSIIATCAVIFISGLYRTIPNLFGWDSTTLFFIVLTLITLLCYIKHPTALILGLLAILSAVTGLVRIPNIIIIPIVAFVMIWKSPREGLLEKIKDKNLLVYICLSLAVICVILVALYGSLSNYIRLVHANQLSAHPFIGIICAYMISASKIIFIILALFSIFSIMNYFVLDGKPRSIGGLGVIAGLSFLIFISLFFNQSFTSNLNFPIECILSALVYVLYKERNNLHGSIATQAISMILLGCIGAVGSNTGLVKFVSWALIPITLGFLLKYLSSRVISLYALVFGVPLVVTLMLYSRVEAFAESGLRDTTFKIESGKAAGLYTTAERKQIIDDVNNCTSSLPKDCALEVLGESTSRFGYEYLFGSRGEYAMHEWSDLPLFDDEGYLSWVQSKLDNTRDDITCIYIKRVDNANSRTKSLLESQLNLIHDTKTFSVFSTIKAK